MRPEYSVSRRDFPYLAVEMVVEGEGTLMLNGRRFRLAPGVMFAYGPGVPHVIRNHPRRCMRKYYLDFTGTAARRLLQATGLAEWKALRVSTISEFVDIFESLGCEAQDDSAVANHLCEMLARLLLLKIQQRVVSRDHKVPQSFQTYERVRRHILEQFLHLHTVEDIARDCHLSPTYISRLFRRFGSTGAYHFLLRLKMNHAAELLLEDGILVKQIAARLGFADVFQFSRAFKRVYRVSPTMLLDKAREL